VDANPDRRVLGAAISPANPEVMYLAAAGPYELVLLRSRDAGATWERARPVTNGDTGSLRRTILEPHPTDASRLFRSDLSGGGTSTGNPLQQSRDQGATWADFWRNPSGAPRRMASPSALVGGQGAAPSRFYLALLNDARVGGSSLQRSDDDGATWTEMVGFKGFGGDRGTERALGLDPDDPSIVLTGLAYNPAVPDRVYVGVNENVRESGSTRRVGRRVITSGDGGATWTDLSEQDIGAIQALALGIDGRNLYAATDQGVWRLPLDR
jgi:hypothetical protein